MPRAWHLISRPQGLPNADDFALKEIELLPVTDGMIRVRNLWLSVDPYMRGRMNESKSYIPPFQIDAPMDGGAVGEVAESKADGFAPGDLVAHFAGWRDEAVVPAKLLGQLVEVGKLVIRVCPPCRPAETLLEGVVVHGLASVRVERARYGVVAEQVPI